jgi:hypothetical protein
MRVVVQVPQLPRDDDLLGFLHSTTASVSKVQGARLLSQRMLDRWGFRGSETSIFSPSRERRVYACQPIYKPAAATPAAAKHVCAEHVSSSPTSCGLHALHPLPALHDTPPTVLLYVAGVLLQAGGADCSAAWRRPSLPRDCTCRRRCSTALLV